MQDHFWNNLKQPMHYIFVSFFPGVQKKVNKAIQKIELCHRIAYFDDYNIV